MSHLSWMFRELRPVGETISTRRDGRVSEDTFRRYFPHPLVFYQSGTAALAAALMACKTVSGVKQPEVLLPAYACPDLLSAVDYAGLRPVLVDFESDKPWMAIPDLRAKINDNTVAIIAVNFLGIPERIAEICRVIGNRKTFVVEDRAQSLPENLQDPSSGDLVILSFGKGKPVALLHGGALIIKNQKLDEHIVRPQPDASGFALFAARQYLKILAYNMVIRPRVYWALKYIPLLHLGETRYKPLSAIEPMKPASVEMLEHNLRSFHGRMNVAAYFREALTLLSGEQIINLPMACDCSDSRLLRYPLLLESKAQRNDCLRSLRAKGLGASTMYPAVLPAIKGVNLPFAPNDYPNAADFADRLITLPLHSDVTVSAVNEIVSVFRQCLGVSCA